MTRTVLYQIGLVYFADLYIYMILMIWSTVEKIALLAGQLSATLKVDLKHLLYEITQQLIVMGKGKKNIIQFHKTEWIVFKKIIVELMTCKLSQQVNK